MRLLCCFPTSSVLALLASALPFALTSAKDEGPKPRPWSFAALQPATLPLVKQKAWPRTRTDAFLLARLEASGLQPAAQAEPRVLLRRLYFDLTGLPPSPEVVESFAADPSEAHYARLVRELLASPQYGERWGRYWLDLARYVDQVPSWLENTSSSHRYRDWVVQAFNDDMPYDEFVMRQLAADQMPGWQPTDLPALGFLGLAPTYFKELQLPPDIIRTTVADEWEEHVDALGRTFLGLTLACARCHDHKSDPVTAQDYYALAGVFASVRQTERPMMGETFWRPVAAARSKVAELEKQRDTLKKALAASKAKAKTAAKAATTTTSISPAAPAAKPAAKTEDPAAALAKVEAEITRLKTSTPHYDMAMANAVEDAALFVVEADNKKGTKLDYKPSMARDLELMRRGNPNDLGERVPRRFLSAFPQSSGQPRTFTRGAGRLELAQALVGEARPLTARVMVNRVWKHHFGRGLVDTPSEFGNLGDAPSHPELLDDLTARFIENGWSIKWLHREILLSAAWRQTSQAAESERRDPENKLLSRMPRRRLDLEAWRDSMLAATGTLDSKLGGPAQAISSPGNHRRTLYSLTDRQDMDSVLRLHDFPDPGSHSPSRPETITPLQQLFALNGPIILELADALAKRLSSEPTSSSLQPRIARAYALLYQRPPAEQESRLAQAFLAGRETDSAAWSQYAQALLASNETLFID